MCLRGTYIHSLNSALASIEQYMLRHPRERMTNADIIRHYDWVGSGSTHTCCVCVFGYAMNRFVVSSVSDWFGMTICWQASGAGCWQLERGLCVVSSGGGGSASRCAIDSSDETLESAWRDVATWRHPAHFIHWHPCSCALVHPYIMHGCAGAGGCNDVRAQVHTWFDIWAVARSLHTSTLVLCSMHYVMRVMCKWPILVSVNARRSETFYRCIFSDRVCVCVRVWRVHACVNDSKCVWCVCALDKSFLMHWCFNAI